MRTTLLSLVTLYSVSLVFTQSRGAMVAAMVGLAVVAFSRGRRMGFAVLAGFALIGAVAYPLLSEWRFGVANEGIASLADAGGRVGAWQAGLDMFVASPLFGIGFGQFVERAPLGIAAHNWYVQVLAELGLAGFVLWALFIVATMVTLRGASHWARTVGYSALAVWMAASLTLAPPFVFGMSGSVLIAIAAACAAAWPLVRAPR